MPTKLYHWTMTLLTIGSLISIFKVSAAVAELPPAKTPTELLLEQHTLDLQKLAQMSAGCGAAVVLRRADGGAIS